MIGVRLENGKNFTNCFSLIDSGTDSTLINADFAQILGIDESKCPKIKVGTADKSTAQGFKAKITLKVDGFDRGLETEVIFLKNMMTGGLLGQKDIFENFKIRFEKKRHKFYLLEE
ncbi:MAG: aspartyl protease family protein [Patescibacteria group bacterium]